MAQYNIGEFVFESKEAARKAVSATTTRYALGQSAEGQDECLLLALVEKHPWRESLLKKGFVRFDLYQHPRFRKLRLWRLVREDGTSVDISAGRFFTSRNKTKPEIFRERCREAIAFQIMEFKRFSFWNSNQIVCALTNVWISPRETHVDHVWAFEDMIQAWERENNFNYSRESVLAFAEWHKTAAKLRCVSIKANLSRGRG